MSEVPAGWAERALGDFCVEVSRRGGDVPVLSVSKDLGVVLQTEKFKKRVASDDTSRYKRILHGEFVYDPMLLWTGSICRQLRVPEGCVSPAYCTFTVNDSVDHGFLDFFLRRPEILRHYRDISRGTNVRRQKAPFASFGELRFPLPPLGEQRKIAAILTAVDKAIAQTQAVIDQLQVVKKGLMQELLTKGIPGRHTRFKQTEHGKIPSDWNIRPLSDLVTSCDYGINGKVHPGLVDGIVVLRMGNLQQGELDFGDLKYIPRAEFATPELLLAKGDLLFNRTNSLELVGKVALVREQREMTFASYLLRLRCDRQHAEPSWLNYVLNTDEYQRWFSSIATQGVSQANVNRTKLLATLIRVPPLLEQREISAAIDTLRLRLAGEHSKLVQVRELKQALTSRLLTGKLRVLPEPTPERAP